MHFQDFLFFTFYQQITGQKLFYQHAVMNCLTAVWFYCEQNTFISDLSPHLAVLSEVTFSYPKWPFVIKAIKYYVTQTFFW